MEPSTTPDPINLTVWLLLAVCGAILCLAGWYQLFS